jgi:hypothetical protein
MSRRSANLIIDESVRTHQVERLGRLVRGDAGRLQMRSKS